MRQSATIASMLTSVNSVDLHAVPEVPKEISAVVGKTVNITCQYNPDVDGHVSLLYWNSTDGTWELMTYDGKLLKGLHHENKYKVTGDGNSLTLTIFDATFGNHCYACRTSNSSNAISCLTVDEMAESEYKDKDTSPRTIAIVMSVSAVILAVVGTVATVICIKRRNQRSQGQSQQQPQPDEEIHALNSPAVNGVGVHPGHGGEQQQLGAQSADTVV